MKKNKMLYRIVAAVLACAVVALALVTYQSRSSSNAPVAEGAVTATGSAKGMEGDVVVEVTADATTIFGNKKSPHNNLNLTIPSGMALVRVRYVAIES